LVLGPKGHFGSESKELILSKCSLDYTQERP